MKRIIVAMSLLFLTIKSVNAIDLYFVTAADEQFYDKVTNLIALLHYYHFDRIQEIVVFDLGFTPQQRSFLNTIAKVNVYDVEKVHPDLLTPFVVRKDGKKARGWYTWKPVVIKQTLDMFPYVLYIDAGIVVNGPLDLLFEHIVNVGYLFVDCTHSCRPRITEKTKKYFGLDQPDKEYLLDQMGIAAGFQGVSRAVYDDYVFPMYELAHHLEYFEDDGTAPMGFGEARHDQIIATIFVNKLGYKILGNFLGGLQYLETAKGPIPFHLQQYVTFWSRFNTSGNLRYLRFKPTGFTLTPVLKKGPLERKR